MAKKNTPPDDEIFDLTELIEEGSTPPRAGAAAYARQAAAPPAEENDFEAALSQASGNAKAAQGGAFNPDETLDLSDLDEIDNMIESLHIPSQPDRSARPIKPQAEAMEEAPAQTDGLDSVLDMLAGPDIETSGPPASKPAAASARKAAPEPGPDADLDDLLSSFDEPPAPKPAAAPARTASPEAELDADLDDLLSSFDEPPAPTPAAAPAKTASPEAELDADLDKILESAAQKSSAGEGASVAEETPRVPAASADELDLPDNLDDLLADSTSEKPETEKEESPGSEIAHVQESAAEMEVPRSTATLVAPELSQEMIANICQGMLATHMGSFQDTIQKLSLEMGSQTAHLEDLSRTVTDISRRLFATESKLAAARTKIASLEKSLASISSLDDLFKEGTSLHTGFMNLLASSVGHAVQGVMGHIQASGVQPAQMQALAHVQEETDGRLIQLETRLDQLEPALTARMDVVETGAARIAARLETESPETNLSGRMEALENRLGALEASAQTGLSEHVESLQKQLDEFGPELISRLDAAEAKNAETASALEEKLAQNPAASELEALASRIDGLEPQLEARIAKLEESLAGMSGKAGDDIDARVSGLEQKLDAIGPEIESKIAASEAKAVEAASSLEEKLAQNPAASELEALASRIDGIEPQFEARIAKLEESLAGMSGKAGDDIDARMNGLEQKLDAIGPEIELKIAASEAKAVEAASSLEEKLAQNPEASELEALASRIDGLEPQLEARLAKLEANMTKGKTKGDVESRLASLQKKLDAIIPDFESKIAVSEAKAVEAASSLEEKLSQNPAASELEALTSRIDGFELQLEERLAKIESDISAIAGKAGQGLEAKIASLQAQLDEFMALTARLEQAETRANEIEARFEAISANASNAEIGVLASRIEQAQEFSDDVGKKIAKLSSVGQSVNARVDSLEIRLDKLEPNFNIQIEKAAAATVARILNEEIRRLAGGQ